MALRKHCTRIARGLSSRHPQVNALGFAFVATLTLALSLSIAAQQTTTAPTTAPAGIAPLLEEETAAIIVVDLDKIDLKALDDFVAKLYGESGLPSASKELKKLIDAKAGKIVISLNFMDIPGASVPVAFLPKAGADPKPLRKLLAVNGLGGRSPNEIKAIGDLLVAAPERTLKRISKNTVKRPDLEKALAADGDAAIKIAFALPESTKATIEELMPTLPQELGGGDSSALSEGLRWGVITIQSPPKLSIRSFAQAKDKETADRLKDTWVRAIKVIAEEAKITPQLVDKETFGKVMVMLTPQVKDGQVILDLSPEQTDFVMQKLIFPALHHARSMARRAASASNLMNLCKDVLVYTNEHKDQWPDDLTALVKDNMISKKMLKNFARPDLEVGYVYVKPAVPANKLNTASPTILIYEAYKEWGAGINVAYTDGHVEFVADQKVFEGLLKKSTSAPAANASSTMPTEGTTNAK